jgi:hypothetical protein
VVATVIVAIGVITDDGVAIWIVDRAVGRRSVVDK